jgi:hypothetical protein
MFVDPLPLWRSVKSTLPPVVTGAYEPAVGDSSPAEALYNLVFVRLPTLVVGAIYFQRVSSGGRDIVMDLGVGEFTLSPILVLFAMWLILRPA